MNARKHVLELVSVLLSEIVETSDFSFTLAFGRGDAGRLRGGRIFPKGPRWGVGCF